MTITHHCKKVLDTGLESRTIILHKCKEPRRYKLEIINREVRVKLTIETSVFYTVFLDRPKWRISLIKANKSFPIEDMVSDLLHLGNNRVDIFRAKDDLDQLIKKANQ